MVHRLSINKLLVLFVTTFIFCSCLSLQNYDYQYVECQETPKEAINIAIADYSKKHLKQKNNGDVRAVDVHINYTSTDWFYISMVPQMALTFLIYFVKLTTKRGIFKK